MDHTLNTVESAPAAQESHYAYLDREFLNFLDNLGIQPKGYEGLIAAHGDKCYSYKDTWKAGGLEFPHGVAIYLLTHIHPYASEVRNTDDGWVPPERWVLENKARFEPHLPATTPNAVRAKKSTIVAPKVPTVLFHGTKRSAAKKILVEGFRHTKTPTYTGTGTCLADDIATACEYGCYENNGCVIEVRLKSNGRYGVFDTQKHPPFSPKAYDEFLKANQLDALCNVSECLWVLWQAGAVEAMRILPKREAMLLLVEQFKNDGPNMGYNAFVGDLAVVFHNDIHGMKHLRPWQIESAAKVLRSVGVATATPLLEAA